MKTIYRRRFWWVLSVAAGMLFVLAAVAQATSARTSAETRPLLVPLPNAPMLRQERPDRARRIERSVRSARSGRTVANANPASFSDPSGDSGTAPDIAGVVVSNSGHQIRFRVNVVKLVIPSDGHLLIAIDSDHNAGTGYNGADYAFLGDLSTNSFVVGRWNGSDFDTVSAPTATASTDTTGLTFSINSSDLGNTTDFGFWVRTLEGESVAAGNHDDAPDAGAWEYQLGPGAALTLTVGLVTKTSARAGKPFVAAIEVVRSDGAETALSPDDVRCSATVGTHRLNARTIVGDGPAAGCAWLLPKKSRGKTLRAAVTAALDGATVTRTFRMTIK